MYKPKEIGKKKERKKERNGDKPNQNLSQTARTGTIDELLGIGELDVHIRVDADETTLVLGLTPFQTDEDVLVDAV